MTEPTSPPYPQQRTPEQHAAVRRRAMPVAASGAILAVAGIVLLLMSPLGIGRPPNIVAVNLSFCGILMGVGILFYARGTSGTGAAAVACALAILAGVVGTLVFARQTVEHHRLSEQREEHNVKALALGAAKYAADHGGVYPTDLLVLLEERLVTPDDLQSPFIFRKRYEALRGLESLQKTMPRAELLKAIEGDSDYLYVGADLKTGTDPLPKEIIVASSNTTIMRKLLALAFADGHVRFITTEEIDKVMEDCNKGRKKVGLGPLRPPPIIERAMEEAATATHPGGR